MARRYIVSFEQVTVTAAQDFVTIIGGTGKACRIIRQWWGCTDTVLATGQNLSVRGRLLPATVSAGSGGSTPTPRPLDGGDAAAVFTAHTNDTSKTTSSGTVRILEENGSHLFAGYALSYPAPPIVEPTAAYVFELLSTVSGSITISGGVEVEELG